MEAAIQKKVEGKEVSLAEAPSSAKGGNVIDLMEALRASIDARGSKASDLKERKAPKRAPRTARRANPLDDEMHAYDAKDLERLFGLPRFRGSRLSARRQHPAGAARRAGCTTRSTIWWCCAPRARCARRNISSQRINRTCRSCARRCPRGRRSIRLSLTALGNRIAIREGQTLRESESGQYALALEIVEEKGRLHVISRQDRRRGAGPFGGRALCTGLCARGHRSAGGTRGLSKPASPADPGHLEARINLGRLLHLAGRLADAERVYRAAPASEPLLVFNLAVLLEDLGREPDAIAPIVRRLRSTRSWPMRISIWRGSTNGLAIRKASLRHCWRTGA